MTEEVTSETKLFVSGLAWKMRGLQLREEFEKFGEVVFARVVLDKDTGRSRGFGFVEFVNPEDAEKAKEGMNETELWEREIKVDFAKENPEKLQARKEAMEAEAAAAEDKEEDEE